jgi:hypothetical protein
MAGYGTSGGSPAVTLVRLNVDGSLDTAFGGTNGVVQLAATVGNIAAFAPPAMIIDRADRIVVAFTEFDASTSRNAMVVWRLLADGTQDPYFPAVEESFAACVSHDQEANAVAIDSAGRLLVAGVCDSEFGVERLRGDFGTLDYSFGINGFSHGHFSASSTVDSAYTVVFDGSGRPLLGGRSFNQAGVARLTYDLIYTNNFESEPPGCLPPDCGNPFIGAPSE